MRFRKLVVNLGVSLIATALCLVFLEAAVRGYHAAQGFFAPTEASQPPPVPLHVVNDTTFLYGLNPKHPDLSSQGTRDDEVTVPKPKGTLRILVLGRLGDSVERGPG